MRVTFRFKLSHPVLLEDSWPVRSGDAVFSFGGSGLAKSELTVTLRNQPVALAPKFDSPPGQDPIITLRHGTLLPNILDQLDIFQNAASVVCPIEVNTEDYSVEFKSERTEEDNQIPITSWASETAARDTVLPFDVIARGFLLSDWPDSDRKAGEFYRRAWQAFREGYYVDAFVNFYFYLERLFAAGKFKTNQVVELFLAEPLLGDALRALNRPQHADAMKRGAKLTSSPRDFFEWIVERRGFFQHQSEKDATRWLHSTQKNYNAEAYLMADYAMKVYHKRNSHLVFASGLEQRLISAARESAAVMKIDVEIFGSDPGGRSIRRKLVVNGLGASVTPRLATGALKTALQFCEENLISVRQLTATLQNTNEVVFTYMGPATQEPNPRVEGPMRE